MPRPSKGIRLHLRGDRYNADGKLSHASTWTIRDGSREIFTGCAPGETGKAEQKLKDYIAAKYTPTRKAQDIETIPIGDVLSIYLDDRPELAAGDSTPAKRFQKRIDRLNNFFGKYMLADINGALTRAYVKERGSDGGARRDLEDLRAAIGHHASEGLHRGLVKVTLPAKGKARDRWLTRSEAAALIWACWRTRETQTIHRGPMKGQKVTTDKRPLRHLARFILIGLYTGTRASAIAAASPVPAIGRAYVDLDRGIFYRLAEGHAETNKRQPPVPLPPRLLAHMRRWRERKLIARHFVEFNGAGVQSVKTGFKTAVGLAKLPGKVSPHTLRHTAATWLMQTGTPTWIAAGFLGMSEKTLIDTYGHHHPEFLQDAVENMTKKPRQRVGVKPSATVTDIKNHRPGFAPETTETNVDKEVQT
ncbi:tyrosine-type recombinase/integrase [Rhodopseudomonas sp. P2A-2r]|uniref:tyrosine-type recombinase/integrase n=1 Tax=Rhodopseudomonas sp. P2A-2r TaxID=2991972 RepID=UPI00223486F5|nr:tyrosine-type recombinase/integrase [Rhodopseudomonas sp. P2A-2r]UZE51091.1 tyrosine-type recombinase/integrase [Rhodopseudomonas sp. P2A-2r]